MGQVPPQGHRPAAQPLQSQGPRPKILRIGVILGGKIVEERLIRNRESVTIGQSARNTFAIPAPELPKSWTLFQLVGGRYMLNVAEGMDGRLSDGAQVLALAALKSSGQAQRVGTGWQVPLSDNARGKVVLGDLTLLFQFVMAPPLQPRPQLPHSVRGSLADRIDPYMAIVLVLSFMMHGGLGLYVYQMDVPKPPPIDEIPDRFAQGLMKPIVKPQPKKVDAQGAGDVVAKEDPGPKAGDDKDKGKPKDKKPPGPPDAAAVSQQVQNSAVLKVLGAKTATGSGRFVDVTGGKDAGGSLDKGLANVGKSGTGIAVAGAGSGIGGGTRGPATGVIGTGTYTGVSGPTGPGNVGGTHVDTGPKGNVSAGRLSDIDSGGLDPGKVAGAIKGRYLSGVKQCYERALKANPSLSGTARIGFVVGPAGTVTKVNVDFPDNEVATCIAGRARSWRFDKPEQGSAEFEVPVVLRPGN